MSLMSLDGLLLLLYIPIWFYSNKYFFEKLFDRLTLHSNLVLFKSVLKYWFITISIITLHSNLVLFKFVRTLLKCLYFYFTFQSGSIQIVLCLLSIVHLITLHSNLVLFKSVHIIPPIYTAWKALFCRPINKWFLQWRYFYNLSLFSPSKPLFITFVDLPISYSYIGSTKYFISLFQDCKDNVIS